MGLWRSARNTTSEPGVTFGLTRFLNPKPDKTNHTQTVELVRLNQSQVTDLHNKDKHKVYNKFIQLPQKQQRKYHTIPATATSSTANSK